MRFSQLLSKTSKQAPHDEVSTNAKLLVRAGFVDKVAAGIYTYLPLGRRVLEKISNIIREEMNAAQGEEVTMPVLHPKANWETTGRWQSFDVLYKTKAASGEFALGPSHEEIVVPLVKKFVSSYNDLPKYVYQIQTKFRDEPRAKSGLLRGREFLMKDLYSFHANEADMLAYYEKMKSVYKKTFERLGLSSILTEAAGGTFSKTSHEFQVLADDGEDTIYYCKGSGCGFSQNKEVATVKAGDKCQKCAKTGHDEVIHEGKSIEVGNIFPLRDKYSKAFDLTYVDKDGRQNPVLMGCYGIGITRAMGAIVEVHNDDSGIIWPASVSPFDAHLVHIEDVGTEPWAKETYEKLTKAGVEVLWDDRENVSAGEKFADADLIGIPNRLVVSKKVGKGKIEVKERDKKENSILSLDVVIKKLS